MFVAYCDGSSFGADIGAVLLTWQLGRQRDNGKCHPEHM
jgi:hypothetical protein